MRAQHYLLASLFILFSPLAHAEDYVLTLKDHEFAPKELSIPAGEKVKLTVKNMNSAPAEFESHDLKREKVIGANKEAIINIGPLKPGTYAYFDEFHEESKGTIIAK